MSDILQELIECKMKLAESEDRCLDRSKQFNSANHAISRLSLELEKLNSEQKQMQETINLLTVERTSLRRGLKELSGTPIPNKQDSVDTEEEEFRSPNQFFVFRDNEQQDNISEWSSILEQWDNLGFTGKLKLRTLAKKGIPTKFRGEVWRIKIENKLLITQELFSMLLARARDSGFADKEENGSMLIPVDLKRTLGNLQVFQKEQPLHTALGEVLEAFAAYRPDIGYIQGMAYLGGIWILHLNAYKAFECFVNMIFGSEMLRTFYSFDIKGIHSYYRVFLYYMKKKSPLIHAYFEHIGLTPDAYLLEWVNTLFSRCFSIEIVR